MGRLADRHLGPAGRPGRAVGAAGQDRRPRAGPDLDAPAGSGSARGRTAAMRHTRRCRARRHSGPPRSVRPGGRGRLSGSAVSQMSPVKHRSAEENHAYLREFLWRGSQNSPRRSRRPGSTSPPRPGTPGTRRHAHEWHGPANAGPARRGQLRHLKVPAPARCEPERARGVSAVLRRAAAGRTGLRNTTRRDDQSHAEQDVEAAGWPPGRRRAGSAR